MLIGVLSDTHIHCQEQAQQLADYLLSGPFSEVEAILHAGDAVVHELAHCFYPIPWYAVRGNMDQALVDVPISRVVTFEDKKIGLIHGWGSIGNIQQRVMRHFAEEQLDAIVFGHSHMPVCRKVGSILLFNPGSAVDRRTAPQHTVGILKVEPNAEISAEIIPID